MEMCPSCTLSMRPLHCIMAHNRTRQHKLPRLRRLLSLHEPRQMGEWSPRSRPRLENALVKPSSTQEVQEVKGPVVSSHTHYTDLVRKELRLHADQADELTVLASKVQRARREKGERITDNTLIRVAVDLLLERQKELVGSTEDELRVALGLAPRA